MERRSEEFKGFLNYYVDEVIRLKSKKEDEELESIDENGLNDEFILIKDLILLF